MRLNALLAENADASKEKQYHLKRDVYKRQVLNARKIVVYAVRVNGVVVVVNGNVANAILGKSEVCVQTCQGRIASQSGQILRDNDSYTPRFNLDQHTLKAGAVVVRAGISIVHKEHRVRKVILLSVFQKNSLLVLNGQAFAEPCVLLRQSRCV